jgi:hypothetical protein
MQLGEAVHLANTAVKDFQQQEFPLAAFRLTRALGVVKNIMRTMETALPINADPSSSTRDMAAVCLPLRPRPISSSRVATGDMMDAEDDEIQDSNHVLLEDGALRRPLIVLKDSKEFASDKLITWDRHQLSGRPYLYDTPFYISLEALAQRTMTHRLLSEISIAIMFNLALCHHMRAVYHLSGVTSEPRQHLQQDSTIRLVLNQAISLYELAYEVQVQMNAELSVECTMAMANNLGLIHQELGDTTKASMCFTHLLSTLVLIRSNATYEYYGLEEGHFDTPELITEGFVHSVSHLILKTQAAAAA